MPRWDNASPQMPGTPGQPIGRMLMKRGAIVLAVIVVIVVLKIVASCVIRVDSGKMAVLIKKTGTDLKSGEIVAPDASSKGIQREPLTEGWHFVNPYVWEAENDLPQVTVPTGMVGLKIRKFGTDIDALNGQVLAGEGQKGIEKDVLTPGRYAINPYLYDVDVEHYKAVQVPGKHVGIVTLIAGREPKDPNRFVVEPGERGTQSETISSGTYYFNPFEKQVHSVSLESNRYSLGETEPILFPSLDGFLIQMYAVVEWAIAESSAPEVFVKYVDARVFDHGDEDARAKECIVEKVILPNARSFARIAGSKHLAKDLMDQKTREALQAEVERGLKDACGSQGIQIKRVTLQKAQPPEEIASPIRDREMAIQQRDMYTQQIAREKQEKDYKTMQSMQGRSSATMQAKADVAVQVTQAQREKDVALIQAEQKLEVAKKELEAAKNQAAAITSKGQADADVIVYQNTAEASGIKAARAAFGDGNEYVRFLFHQKVAPAIKYVLSNTDGPFVDIFKDFSGKESAPAPKSDGQK